MYPYIGIDVGGYNKGFHAVALNEHLEPTLFHDTHPTRVAAWCTELPYGRVIAIDAPSRWSSNGRARPCEKELICSGTPCFPTPTLSVAQSHPSGYYDWMINGAALYKALEKSYPALQGIPLPQNQKACFETFPHAITKAYMGPQATAKLKREQRTNLLRDAGVKVSALSHIDWIDAACCALAARTVGLQQPCHLFGEAKTGLLIHPKP